MSYVNHNAAANSAPMQAQRSDTERKVPGMGRRGPFKPVEKPVENVYNSMESSSVSLLCKLVLRAETS